MSDNNPPKGESILQTSNDKAEFKTYGLHYPEFIKSMADFQKQELLIDVENNPKKYSEKESNNDHQ